MPRHVARAARDLGRADVAAPIDASDEEPRRAALARRERQRQRGRERTERRRVVPLDPALACRERDAAIERAGVDEHVPEPLRPAQEPLEVDYDPWAGYEWADRAGQSERAPRRSASKPE